MSIQKNLKTNFEKTKVIGRKVVARVPQATIQGFDDGREAGRKFVHGAPYGAGAAVGFGFGASEAIVGFIATPAKALVGWAASAIGCGGRTAHANTVETDMA
jgi:hypothetical protein